MARNQASYDARWRRTRRAFIEQHPVCQHEGGCQDPSTDAHHLDGLGPSGPRGHDFSNLQALCHSHHSAVTAAEQVVGGAWAHRPHPRRRRPPERHPGAL